MIGRGVFEFIEWKLNYVIINVQFVDFMIKNSISIN